MGSFWEFLWHIRDVKVAYLGPNVVDTLYYAAVNESDHSHRQSWEVCLFSRRLMQVDRGARLLWCSVDLVREVSMCNLDVQSYRVVSWRAAWRALFGSTGWLQCQRKFFFFRQEMRVVTPLHQLTWKLPGDIRAHTDMIIRKWCLGSRFFSLRRLREVRMTPFFSFADN